MSHPIIENPPEYVICHFCKENIKGRSVSDVHIKYSCHHHTPLHIDYYWVNISSDASIENWIFYRIIIDLPNKFRLDWLKRKYPVDEDPGFALWEWKKAITDERIEGWRSFKKCFPSDWVLAQTTERLQSLLELYTTFS